MIEYKLDQAQSRTPKDVLDEMNAKFVYNYEQNFSEEKRKYEIITKEAKHYKKHHTFTFVRRFICFVFILMFIATSLLYCGFSADPVGGWVVSVVIGIMLIVELLAGIRRRGFKTALEIAIVCAIIVAFWAMISFGMWGYGLVVLMSILLLILNYAEPHDQKNFTVIRQFSLMFFTLLFIFCSVPGMLGLNPFASENSAVCFERELFSRFAKYDIIETNNEKNATFNSVLLTVKDVLTIASKEVYELDDTVNTSIKVTTVGARAFQGSTSIKTVVLPQTVTKIEARAFVESQIQTIEVHSSEIHIEDSFEDTALEYVKLLSPQATKIVVKDVNALPDKFSFFVPKDLVLECRALNPELADRISAEKE